MAWQRYNPTTHVFEQSTNNGASWTVMPIDMSSIVGGENIAYKNVGNTFTVDQEIRTAFYPSIWLNNTSAPLDDKRWWIRVSQTGELVFQQINDANTLIDVTALTMNPNGSITTANHLTSLVGTIRAQGARGSPPGSGGGIELFFQSGAGYLHTYDITASAYAPIYLYGTEVRINKPGSHLYVSGNVYNDLGYIYPGRADAGGGFQNSWYLASHASYGLFSNTGVYFTGGIWGGAHVDVVTTIRAGHQFYELGRSTALGNWIAYTPTFTASAGTWTVSTISAAYTLIGNTCIVRITAENSATSAESAWIAASLPYAPAGYHQIGAGRIYFPGYGPQGVMCQGNSGDPRMIWTRDIDKGNIAAYPGGGLHVYGFLAYQIG